MDKTSYIEIISSVAFLVLLAAFIDPLMLWMPSEMVYVALAGLIIVFSVFAGVVWRERARDEREQMHKLLAGRIAYVIGTGTLVVGVMYQTLFVHSVDPWLLAALAALVIGKLMGHLYSQANY